MKKIIVIVCSLCLVFMFCSCGKHTKTEDLQAPEGYEKVETSNPDAEDSVTYENDNISFDITKEDIKDTFEEDKAMWEEFANDPDTLKSANGKGGSIKDGDETIYWVSFPEGNGKYYEIDAMVFRDGYSYSIILADKDSLKVEDGDYSKCQELTDKDFEMMDKWLREALESM